MKLFSLIATCLLLSGFVAADIGLQKKQGGDQCQSAQVTYCQQNTGSNERLCEGNCLEVLTEYFKCQGYDEVVIYEECGTVGTTVGSVVFVSALLASLVAVLH